MPKLTSTEAAMLGRIGGLRRSALHDSREMTAKARKTFNGRFEREVDPERILTEAERVRLVEDAKRAYFAALARKSWAVRRERRALRRGEK